MAQASIGAVFCGICLVSVMHVLDRSGSLRDVALSVIYMVALLVLQWCHFGRGAPGARSRAGGPVLLCQAILAYLPFLQFGEAWLGMPGFLAGSVLLVLPAVFAWAAFGVVVVSVGVAQAAFGGSAVAVACAATSTVITGLVVYGLPRLASLVSEVHAARTELARLAVAQERLRFSRDLHDLLGYSLSAITLKSELTSRLVQRQPDLAMEELDEILDISRRALADLRSVAHGYRELSLEQECASARSVLSAAGVTVEMETNVAELPASICTVLATVLREGVTNVLRHSQARNCRITVRATPDAASIVIVNDGVSAGPEEPPRRAGTGILNMRDRIDGVGGTLVAEPSPGGGFSLQAVVPLPVSPAAPPPPVPIARPVPVEPTWTVHQQAA